MRGPRVNKRIRAKEVQLITHEGDNIGIVPIGEALDRAREVGLDLIEVAPNVKPPVCKIIDYGTCCHLNKDENYSVLFL